MHNGAWIFSVLFPVGHPTNWGTNCKDSSKEAVAFHLRVHTQLQPDVKLAMAPTTYAWRSQGTQGLTNSPSPCRASPFGMAAPPGGVAILAGRCDVIARTRQHWFPGFPAGCQAECPACMLPRCIRYTSTMAMSIGQGAHAASCRFRRSSFSKSKGRPVMR